MASRSRSKSLTYKSSGGKEAQLARLLKYSGPTDLGDLGSEQRVKLIKGMYDMFKLFVKQNKILQPLIKDLAPSRKLTRSTSQRGGGEHEDLIQNAKNEITELQRQLQDSPDNPANPQKRMLMVDYGIYIRELKRWRHFTNAIYGLAIPFLSPRFARMFMAAVIHLVSFSLATPAMAGAGAWNIFVAFLGHAFEPLNGVIAGVQTRLANPTGAPITELPDSGACPPGSRSDPTLGCISGLQIQPTGVEGSTWSFDVAGIGKNIISDLTANLQENFAQPLLGIVTVVFAAAMCWRLHIVIVNEDRLYSEKLEKMRDKLRESTRAIAELEHKNVASVRATVASMGQSYAFLGDGKALQSITNGLFAARGMLGAPPAMSMITAGMERPISVSAPPSSTDLVALQALTDVARGPGRMRASSVKPRR